MKARQKVDGVFQVISQDIESAVDDVGSLANCANVDDEDDEDEDLTYNSQGKPISRKATMNEKKQSRKTIAKPARPKQAKKPGGDAVKIQR